MGITRRQLLKRGAIVGVVWATPIINAVPISANAAQAASPETITENLTPQRVLANGAVYNNPTVQNAIAKGYAGVVQFTPSAGPFDFAFTNLDPGSYTVFLDADGGATTGPWTALGTFVADASGFGIFQYAPSLAAGAYNYAFWVNEATGSVLQTVNDLSFTIP